ncbi:hypothetical protein TKK_0007743 [Trichogramma kaykai]
MSSVWSSSEGPIFVKTVWVDGVRHAILSVDDPYLRSANMCQRPHSSSMIKEKSHVFKYSSYKSLVPETNCELNACIVKLNPASDNAKLSACDRGIVRHRSAPVIRCDLDTNYHSKSEHFFRDDLLRVEKLKERFPFANDSSVNNEDEILDDNCKKINDSSADHLKSLSDQVLHWLDHSGMVIKLKLDQSDMELSFIQNGKSVSSKGIVSGNNLNQKILSSCNPVQDSMVQETCNTCYSNKLPCHKSTIIHDQISEQEKVETSFEPATIATVRNRQPETREYYSEDIESSNTYWLPLKKKQLHIFMPNLISSEKTKFNSRESLVIDTFD